MVSEIVLLLKSQSVIFPVILGVLAVVLIFLNLSLSAIFKNSFVIKKIMTFFEYLSYFHRFAGLN